VKALAIGLTALCLAVPLSEAQTTHGMTASCPNELKRILNNSKGQDSLELRQFLTFNGGMDCMTALLLTQTTSVTELLTDRAQAVKAALEQNGTATGSGNSTNLVSKGTTAQVLSLASEYGGLTEATSGQTVTVSGTLGGIPTALMKNGLLSNCGGINVSGGVCLSNKTVNGLNRVSYSVSFNASSTAQTVSGAAMSSTSSVAQQATFTASTNTVSSTTTKFVLLRGAAASITDTVTAINKLSPTSSTSIAGLPTAESTDAKADHMYMADKENGPTTDAATKARMAVWTSETAAKIVAAGSDNAVTAWQQQAAALMNAVCPATEPVTCRATVLQKLVEYAVFVNGYKAGVNAYVESLRKAPLLTLEYDLNRPASQPTNSVFRLVGQTVLGGWTLTFNGAGSIYNSKPSSAIPGSGLLRDFQIAGESSFDFSKLKKSSILGHSTASVAYYFQDQTSPAILNVTPGQPASGVTITGLPSTATQVYAQKGNIDIVQGKFTYSPGSSSITLPLSFTWSNRTELVANSPLWRGQVGISYSFDSLFGGIK
jgi:hypothetical protein